MFWKRLLTSIIALPLALLIVYLGGIVLTVGCAIVSLIGLREIYHALDRGDKPVHFVGYIFTVLFFAVVYLFGSGIWLVFVLMLFFFAIQGAMVFFFGKLNLQECINTIYGFLLVPFLLSFLVLVRQHDQGLHIVWLIFICSLGSDTAAYLTGITIGRRKLVNSPSPSKSLEGVVGGILGAVLLAVVYGFALRFFLQSQFAGDFVVLDVAVEVFIPGLALMAFAGACFSVIGDMAASAIKRQTGIKDFGNIFPGHGGVIDRIDSTIAVAPIFYLVMNIL